MFKVLLSQFKNLDKLSNQNVGVFATNTIPISLTSQQQGHKLIYDGARAANTIPQAVEGMRQWCPTVIDIGHINSTTPEGKKNIEEILEVFHTSTNYSAQAGVVRSWPTTSRQKPTIEQVAKSAVSVFEQDKYGRPHINKLTQFIVCWAHPYTVEWAEWSNAAKEARALASQYNKPIYADITLSFSPIARLVNNKPLDADRAMWMLTELYMHKFDGVLITGVEGDELERPFYESILNALNQINS